MLFAWLGLLRQYARESWAELKADKQRAQEDEYNRLNPWQGPHTRINSMLHDLWGEEILRQMGPVLRFEQLVKKHLEDV